MGVACQREDPARADAATDAFVRHVRARASVRLVPACVVRPSATSEKRLARVCSPPDVCGCFASRVAAPQARFGGTL